MVGKIISHYRIIEALQEDAMGGTYRAEDTMLDREAVLESWKTTSVPDAHLPSRFHGLEAIGGIHGYTFFVRPCLRMIGYWRGTDRGTAKLPPPADLVDRGWDCETRTATVKYLRAGDVRSVGLGCSFCRFCGCVNGSTDLTDGVYLWPEGLAHYLECHDVRLPDEFIDHMRPGIRYEVDSSYCQSLDWWSRALL